MFYLQSAKLILKSKTIQQALLKRSLKGIRWNAVEFGINFQRFWHDAAKVYQLKVKTRNTENRMLLLLTVNIFHAFLMFIN